ncbi:Isocitrate dehydrogenase [NAD] subunit 1, mitochondrial [Smittium mucronatum]|uniref:Isocitrate dehydrogenase [NAD] subunit 1, mitochondrial n=1 Tax=Smittium mucronatum TaxID=133383 RepID=A0A1R0GT72_9FUNG|nr:Isocitrate dehydrogenase [NAD] subunit 1, mitochondrial [Smittium mucronatum]
MFSLARISRNSRVGVRSLNTLSSDLEGPKEYGGRFTVTLIPGDGIGREVANSVKKVFKAANVPVDFEQFNVSGTSSDMDPQLQSAVLSIKRNKVGLKGILFTPISKGHASLNVMLRKELDMYASVTVAKNLPGYEGSRHKNVDLVVIRENTEGEYSGLEHMSAVGVVESLKIITRAKTQRIARYAFDYALKHGRKQVTCVHKANIMKLSDGLFLKTCREVAQEYANSGIGFNDMIVDNTAMQLVGRPQQFDVMVMPNLYGTIVSNVAAGLINGVGTIPGASFGRNFAIFEPGARHVGLDIEGRDVANPTAMLLSSVMMLRHLGLDSYASRIENSVYNTISEGTHLTEDLGGHCKTTEFTEQVISNLLN